jgi:hypothetical protein
VRAGRRYAFVSAAALVGAACAGLLGVDKVDYALADGGLPDGAGADGTAADGPNVGDAGSDAPATYNDFTNPDYWQWFDLAQVEGGLPPSSIYGWSGGVFDGRYVYMAPNADSSGKSQPAARYDTQAGNFKDPKAWAIFDVAPVAQQGYQGATFDGRYVYFVPWLTRGVISGIAVRYDTRARFDDRSSWSTFDLAPAGDYAGATFDGRFVYFAPNSRNTPLGSTVARYDTNAPFDASTSWELFDTQAVGPLARASGYFGTIAIGDFVYFAPSENNVVTRCKARSTSFAANATWTAFDLDALDAGQHAFAGAVFDGQYLYLVPSGYAPSPLVVRYDTRAQDLSAAGAWSTVELDVVIGRDAGEKAYHYTGSFDGRYVYLTPAHFGGNASDLIRYDTTAPFDQATSWSTFDLSVKLNNNLLDFAGAIFDGRYLYLVPTYPHVAARFDAKTPPSMPAAFPGGAGSFY